MKLKDLKEYMQRVKCASLLNLSIYFDADTDMIQGMMSHWIRKGCIRCSSKTPKCHTQCSKCPVAATEIYEWVAVK